MRLEDRSLVRWIVSGAAVGALAMFGAAIGCTKPEPVGTSDIEFDIENSCKLGDSSHTVAPAVTCVYNVSTSSNTGAAITAGTPRKSCGKWVVDCYLSGIKCSGSGTKKPLSCTPPEYLATNQDVSCLATWQSNLRGFQGTVEAASDDSILSQPTAQRALQLCTNKYGDLLTDLNATANNLCNAAASTWTNESKKSAICCIPAPKQDAGVQSMQNMLVACGDDCGSDVLTLPDAGLPDASVPSDGATDASVPSDGATDASAPSDGGATDAPAPSDGATCSIEDPSLAEEPLPIADDGSTSTSTP